MKHLLLTGATGLLGRYLLRDLLRANVPVAVLIRSQSGDPATARLDRLLAQWESNTGHPLPRPVCLEGDIARPRLGLNSADLQWFAAHCGSVLHNAASLTLDGADRTQDPWLSNVTGTSHVLDLCRATGVAEFHYVSTAFVCGQRPGPVLETELDCGQTFRNIYERSKVEAEQLVRNAAFLSRPTVYRPAIIIGDSQTGYTSAYHGLYAYLQFVWLLQEHTPRDPDGRCHLPVRLNMTGDEGRNLVPVDWVSAVIAHILLRPQHHGQTYHLTPRQPVTAREVQAAMATVYNYYGAVFVGPDGLANSDLNEQEQIFYGHVSGDAPWRAYWAQEPRFDCTNTLQVAPHLPCPALDVHLMRRLVDYAVADRWGKRRARRPRLASVS